MSSGAAKSQPPGGSTGRVEKRGGERVRRRLMARFGTRTLDKTAFTMNISERGAYLQTTVVLKPGTTIQSS